MTLPDGRMDFGLGRAEQDVIRECVALMRERIGTVADFKRACAVDRLPKTRSGKILCGTMVKMVKIADGAPFKPPATIDDPALADEIRAALLALGPARPV